MKRILLAKQVKVQFGQTGESEHFSLISRWNLGLKKKKNISNYIQIIMNTNPKMIFHFLIRTSQNVGYVDGVGFWSLCSGLGLICKIKTTEYRWQLVSLRDSSNIRMSIELEIKYVNNEDFESVLKI